jgi:RHS repeat-associated protein
LTSSTLDITGVYNYYPFGQLIDNKTWEKSTGRFGFQSQERDDEVAGKGNSIATYHRFNSTQIGRWEDVDPMVDKFPWQSSYVSMDNNPINLTDPRGGQTMSQEMAKQFAPMRKLESLLSEVADQTKETATATKEAAADEVVNIVESSIDGVTFAASNWTDGKQFNSVALGFSFEGGFEQEPSLNENPTVGNCLRFACGTAEATAGAFVIGKGIGGMLNKASGKLLKPGQGVLRAGSVGKTALNSFDDIVKNPKTLVGKSADDVAEILGDGWIKGTYGSKKTGWKFINKTHPDRSVFYHPGNGRHGGSYYGFSRANYPKTKIVGTDYIPISGDKANIIKIGE